jgi:hypothetical protein
MKTRNGFVSNSSSSSFIIGIPKNCFSKFGKYDNPLNISLYDFCNYLYPENTKVRKNGITYKYCDEKIDVYSASTIIKLSLQGKQPLTNKSQVIEEVITGYFKGSPDYFKYKKESEKFAKDFYNKTNKNIYITNDCPEKIEFVKIDKAEDKKYSDDYKRSAKELVDKIWDVGFKNKYVFSLEFSDNDGPLFTVLEHGNTFSKIPHIKVCKH